MSGGVDVFLPVLPSPSLPPSPPTNILSWLSHVSPSLPLPPFHPPVLSLPLLPLLHSLFAVSSPQRWQERVCNEDPSTYMYVENGHIVVMQDTREV